MMLKYAVALTLACGFAAPAAAHGPPRLKVQQEIVLDAPVAEVWSVVGNFSDASWDPSTVSTTAAPNEKGATRERVMQPGGVVTEELTKYDPVKYAISVRFVTDNTEAIKATNYAAHITLKPEGEKTRMELRGAFYRAFPQNEPPADLNDAASEAAVAAHHQAAIEALAARFGRIN